MSVTYLRVLNGEVVGEITSDENATTDSVFTKMGLVDKRAVEIKPVEKEA